MRFSLKRHKGLSRASATLTPLPARVGTGNASPRCAFHRHYCTQYCWNILRTSSRFVICTHYRYLRRAYHTAALCSFWDASGLPKAPAYQHRTPHCTSPCNIHTRATTWGACRRLDGHSMSRHHTGLSPPPRRLTRLLLQTTPAMRHAGFHCSASYLALRHTAHRRLRLHKRLIACTTAPLAANGYDVAFSAATLRGKTFGFTARSAPHTAATCHQHCRAAGSFRRQCTPPLTRIGRSPCADWALFHRATSTPAPHAPSHAAVSSAVPRVATSTPAGFCRRF